MSGTARRLPHMNSRQQLHRGDYNGRPLAKIRTKLEIAEQLRKCLNLTDLRNLLGIHRIRKYDVKKLVLKQLKSFTFARITMH